MKKTNFLKLSREFTPKNLSRHDLGGFTLIEVLIAIFLITVGMVGALIAIQNIFPSIRIASSKLTAAYLSQEGIEIVRNIRDTNWLNSPDPEDWNGGIFVCGGSFCNCYADYNDPGLTCLGGTPFLKIDGGFYNYDSGAPTLFRREIMVASTTANRIDLTVLITWQIGGKNYQSSTTEYLYNWR